MNNTKTSSLSPERDKGKDLTGLLVIAVAVLGTLVSMALLAAGMWGCFVCGKILYHQRKCDKRRNIGIEGFPSQQREMMEMGYMPHHSPYQHQPPRCENLNNTGISRSLGLCLSRSEGCPPTVPSPRSWTPSPPYSFEQKHACGAANRNFSRHLHKNAGQVKRKVANSYASRLERKGNIQCHIQGDKSSYHPGFNTLASDMWSVRPACSSSSSRHTVRSSCQPPVEACHQTSRKSLYEKQHQRSWRRVPSLSKEPDKYSRYKGGHSPLNSNRCNRSDWPNNLEQDAELPDACSSYRGSPHTRHPTARPLPYNQHHHHFGAIARHCGESFQSPSCNDLPDCAYNRSNVCAKHKGNVTLEAQQSTAEEDQDVSSACHLPYLLPTNSITSTKPRRLWHKSRSFRSKTLSTGPCWVHHLQTSAHKNRQVNQPPSASQQPFHDPRSMDEAHEQEVFRRIALKYGFCEICGMERSPKEQHKCGQSDNRCVAGGCNKCFASYPDEPTPSMSWDNLSPEPSPAVTNIQLSQGLEGAAASAQTIPQQENENGAGTGCNSHTPVQGSTYTISCQSAGEG